MISKGDNTLVNQLANKFGINGEQFNTAVSALVPALAGGIQEKIASGDSALASALSSDKLTQFADTPASLTSPAAEDLGSKLLGQVFGSGDSNNMVSMVAEKAGISSATVGKMLPMVATLVGGMLSKSVASGGNLSETVGALAHAGQGGIMGAVKGLASKVFG